MKKKISSIQPGTLFKIESNEYEWTRANEVSTLSGHGDGYWITAEIDGEPSSAWVPIDTEVEVVETI
jgi:hypothetical protein